MTTPTTKHVSRVTVREYASRLVGHKARKIVVTIAGDNLILRLQRTKQVEYLTIVDAFEYARSGRLRADKLFKSKRRTK